LLQRTTRDVSRIFISIHTISLNCVNASSARGNSAFFAFSLSGSHGDINTNRGLTCLLYSARNACVIARYCPNFARVSFVFQLPIYSSDRNEGPQAVEGSCQNGLHCQLEGESAGCRVPLSGADGAVALESIGQPQTSWSSLLECFGRDVCARL
jgi:hypothetical protein